MADTPAEPYEDATIETEPEAVPIARRRGRWLLPLGIVAVVALVAVGIVVASSGDDGADPVELLGSAPIAAREAKTANMAMQVHVDGGGATMSFEGTGAIDFVTGAQRFEMSLLGSKIEMRFIDEHLYMRLPDEGRPPSIDKDWIGMPVEVGAGMGSGMNLGTGGTGFLDTLQGVSADGITELGEDTINGQDVTGYQVTIDMEKALAAVPDDQRDDVEMAADQMKQMGLDEWPMKVWLNDDGLPVRIGMKMDVEGGALDMQIDYTDFGTDIDVAAPPVGETLEVKDQAELQQVLTGQPAEQPAA